jgi:hypothetical protein
MSEELSPAESEVIDRFCQALRYLLGSDGVAVTLTDLAQPVEAAARSGDHDEH